MEGCGKVERNIPVKGVGTSASASAGGVAYFASLSCYTTGASSLLSNPPCDS